MESERFDGLVRSFGQTRSRRQTLRGLAGAAAGVLALGVRQTAAGSRIGGAPCERDGQCATGKCLASGKCSCSTSVSCTQPFSRCRQATCDVTTKRCVISNKAKGAACPDDGNPCTKNVCDGSGHCTHPDKQNGATCTTCPVSICACEDGTCTAQVCPDGSEYYCATETTPCPSSPSCTCATDIQGNTTCARFGTSDSVCPVVRNGSECAQNADCGAGFVCIKATAPGCVNCGTIGGTSCEPVCA